MWNHADAAGLSTEAIRPWTAFTPSPKLHGKGDINAWKVRNDIIRRQSEDFLQSAFADLPGICFSALSGSRDQIGGGWIMIFGAKAAIGILVLTAMSAAYPAACLAKEDLSAQIAANKAAHDKMMQDVKAQSAANKTAAKADLDTALVASKAAHDKMMQDVKTQTAANKTAHDQMMQDVKAQSAANKTANDQTMQNVKAQSAANKASNDAERNARVAADTTAATTSGSTTTRGSGFGASGTGSATKLGQ